MAVYFSALEGCQKNPQPIERPLYVHPKPSVETLAVRTEHRSMCMERERHITGPSGRFRHRVVRIDLSAAQSFVFCSRKWRNQSQTEILSQWVMSVFYEQEVTVRVLYWVCSHADQNHYFVDFSVSWSTNLAQYPRVSGTLGRWLRCPHTVRLVFDAASALRLQLPIDRSPNFFLVIFKTANFVSQNDTKHSNFSDFEPLNCIKKQCFSI